MLCKIPNVWLSYTSNYCHPILEFLVFIAIPSCLLINTIALFQAFFISYLNKSCPSFHPLCPSTSDIDQCFKFIIPLTCPKIFNDSTNSLVWHIILFFFFFLAYNLIFHSASGIGSLSTSYTASQFTD